MKLLRPLLSPAPSEKVGSLLKLGSTRSSREAALLAAKDAPWSERGKLEQIDYPVNRISRKVVRTTNLLTPAQKAEHNADVRTAISGRHLPRSNETVIPTALTAERIVRPDQPSKSLLFRGEELQHGPGVFLSKYPDVAAGYALHSNSDSDPDSLTQYRRSPEWTHLSAYRQSDFPVQRDQAAGVPGKVTDAAGLLQGAHPLAIADVPFSGMNPLYETVVDASHAPKPLGTYRTRLVRTKDFQPAVSLEHVSGQQPWKAFAGHTIQEPGTLDKLLQTGRGVLKKLADIKTPLLPHQQRVVGKIQRPDQPGLVVAHSVGSGKTLTALAAQDALGMNATAVMPAALRANYRKEMAKHQEGVSPTTDIESLQGIALSGETTPNALLIADESHRVREPSTKAYKALAANDAQKRLLLTGTPFYNHPADLAPLINLASGQRVMPTQRGEFEKKYVRDRMVQPGFFKSLRGVKPGVVTELNPGSKGELAAHLAKWVDYHPGSKEGFPTTAEENIEVPMDAEQLQVYDTMMKKAPYWVAAKVKAGLPPSKAESKELNAFLGAVRQVSNTTGGFGGKTVHSPKIQRAYEELEKEMAQNPEARAVIYSNFLESGVHPYRQLLQAHHVPFGEFTGEQKPADRDQMVRDYNEGKLKALLLSSAGGEGLDLKKTSLMQLLEPHWNETRGDQVIGRGVRYHSHEGMAEDAQKVRIQRFLATRPRSGMMERAHLKDPGMGVDQYLTQMSADKSRLIDQFKALLEDQNKRELAEAAAKERQTPT